MLKKVNKTNNTLKFIKTFSSNKLETLNALDACGCTGNGSC